MRLHAKDIVRLTRDKKIVTEPEIEEFPTNTTAIEGEGVVFKVVVRGNPQPSLTWYYEDILLSPDYSLELQQDGSVVIASSELRHSGVYRLSAKNSKGSVDREVALTVRQEEEEEGEMDVERIEIKPVSIEEFGEYVAQSHSNSNEVFLLQYGVCAWL